MFTLLYVDDEPGLLELGKLFLESTGEFTVTTALSGTGGLDLLEHQTFDAIVSDFQMPVMNGIEFLKQVRKRSGPVPFVLFTGRGREEVVIDAINNGVDFYLQKGGDPKAQFAELSLKVRQAVLRRRAEAALSESEKRLADIIDFLPDATFAIDTNGTVIAWNRAIEEMTGVPASEILGNGNYAYAVPFYQDRRPILIDLIFEKEAVIAEKYDHITRSKEILTADTVLPRPKGQQVTLMGVAGPLYNRQGKLTGAIESIRDITDRKRAEDALNESERRFRELADLLPQGIYEADISGRVTYANRIALELSGYTALDIEKGLQALSFIAPEDRPRAAAVFAQMAARGTRGEGSAEYLAMRKDGGTFPVSIYSSPICRDDRIAGIRGIIIDITEQKTAEQRLITANREYTNLLDQMQDVYYFSDTQGTLVRASKSLAILLGYGSLAECLGKNVAEDFYFNPQDRTALIEELRHNKSVAGFEVRLRRKDGTPVLVETSSHLSYGPDGTVNGVEGTFRDITERKKAAEELAESREYLSHIYSAVQTGIVVIDAETHQILDANAAAVAMIGTEKEKIVGKPCHRFICPAETGNCPITDLGQCVDNSERILITADGERKSIIKYVSRIRLQGRDCLLETFIDNTPRKRAEEELRAANEQLAASGEELRAQYDELAVSEQRIRESEQKYRTVFEITGTAMVIIEEDATISLANSEFCRMSGYPREEIESRKNWTEFVVPGDRDRMLAQHRLRRTEYDRALRNYEFRFLSKSGEIRDVFLSIDVIPGTQKSVASLLDITEKKRATDELRAANERLVASEEELRKQYEELATSERNLRENEENFQNLVESAPDAIYISVGQEFAYVNPAMIRLMGATSADQLVGHPLYERIHPDYHTAIRGRAEFIINNRAPAGLTEVRYLRMDGTPVWVQSAVSPFQYQKQFAGLVILRDITEQKKMETAIRDSEEKYRTLVETTGTGFVILNSEGCVLDANPEYVRLTGYETLEEITGRSVTEWTAGYEREKNAEAVRQCIRDGYIRNLEIDYCGRDGSITPIEINATVLQAAGSGIILTLCRDITMRKRQEDELLRLKISTDRSSDEIFWMDFAGNILYVNDAACRTTGYTREEFLKMKIFELDPYLPAAGWNAAVEGLREKKTHFFTTRHRRKDGVMIDVEILAVYVNQYDKEFSFTYVREITERKRTEDALFSSQQMLTAVLDSIPQRVFWKDRNSVYLGCNKSLAEDAGYSDPAELVGKDDYATASKVTAEQYRDDDRKVMETGEPKINFEEPQIRPDGSHAWLRTTKVPLRSKEGEIIGVLGTYEDITERKHTEEALRESEEKYRTLVESSFDGILIHQDGVVVYINRTGARLYGSDDPGLFIGKSAIELIAPECRPAIAERIREAPEKVLELIRERLLRIDGSIMEADVTTTPTTWNGKPAAYVTFRDISGQVKAEAALRESEARLSSILHGSPVLQFVIDRNHRVISWNKALEEYTGIQAADIIGTDHQWHAFYAEKRPVLADILLEGDLQSILALYAGKSRKSRYVDDGIDATDFFPHMEPSGKWLSFTAAPVRDVHGVIIGAVETLEDVTDRINAEQENRQSEERSRTILNSTQTAIILVDAGTYQIIDANRKALDLIGRERDSVVGKICHHFICPAEEGRCPVTDLGQNVDTSERVLINAAGERIPVLKTVAPVSIGNRNVLIESFIDITDQKRSETAIREASRKLNLLNSITRHDIRNQLTIAQGYAQLAAMARPDPTIMDFLGKISNSIETIENQIEFTKAYQELGVHTPAWFRVDSLAESVRPERITLKNTCRGVEIYADPMIDKVFFNLYDNALKHGERVTEVAVGCGENDDCLVITFADNGRGIPDNEKEKIFEKGYGKNTGLGLFLVREILSITGITIRENGTFGGGAVFEIHVPKGVYRLAP